MKKSFTAVEALTDIKYKDYLVLDSVNEDGDHIPVFIMDGEMYEATEPYDCETRRRAQWDWQECDWYFEPEDEYAPYHGLTYYECNTDWRQWR